MVDAASEVKEPDCVISDEITGKTLTKYEAMLERVLLCNFQILTTPV